MSRSSGIGIWSDQFETRAKVHINFWKFDRTMQADCHFLDIGVLLQKISPSNGEAEIFSPVIKLYFPFPIDKKEIEDLYEKTVIKGSIYLIFNKSDLTVNICEPQGYAQISNLLPDKDVYASAIPRIEVCPKDHQTVTLEMAKSLKKDDNAYLRIRVYLNQDTTKFFSQKFRPRTSFLLPSFSEIEHVSFNINERRSLPSTISTDIVKKKFQMTAVDFFLVRESEASLLSQYSPFKRCRELEHNIWSAYLPTDAKDFNIKLAYHWQEKINNEQSGEYIEHFGAFAKFSYNNDGLNVIIMYLAIALFLGILAGSGGNLISDSNTTKQVFFDHSSPEIIKNIVGVITVTFIGVVLIFKILQMINLRRFFKYICHKIRSCIN